MFIEYARKSGIRGFTYAETNNKFARLMWYGIMLVCAGMTIYDVSGTVRYFLSFPTTTKVVLINNQSINLGSPTVSVSFKNTITNMSEFQSWFKQNTDSLTKSVKKYYLDKVSLNTSAEVEMISVQTAISLTVAVVSSVTRAEHYLADSNHPHDFGWGYARIQKENGNDTILNDASDQVEFTYNWLLANNLSIREAAVVSVKLLCQLFSFSVTMIRQPEKSCEVIEPTWLGMQPVPVVGWYNEMLSFKLPFQMFTFSSSYEDTTVRFKRPQTFSDSNIIPTGYVKLDFSGGPTFLDNAVNVAYQEADTNGWTRATITAQYKQLNTIRSPCSDNDYISNCQFKGRKRMIKDLCGCNPLDLNEDLRVEKQCSIETFKGSANKNCSKRTVEYISAQLSSNCHQKCERPTMSFIQGDNHIDKSAFNGTSIQVSVDTFSFPLFEEIPLLEPKQILGSLGGNLSLYLGANFMLLYYTIFYWITTVISKAANRAASRG